MGRPRTPADTRFDAKWELDPTTGCHLWTAGQTNGGYGQFWDNYKSIRAHRFAYERKHGPTEFNVLHRCDTPPCVNDEHLFEGTTLDNNRDCLTKGRHGQKNKTRCPQRHEYTEENTYTDRAGKRHCKICMRTREKAA